MSCDTTAQRRSHVQAIAGAELAKSESHGCLCDCAVVRGVAHPSNLTAISPASAKATARQVPEDPIFRGRASSLLLSQCLIRRHLPAQLAGEPIAPSESPVPGRTCAHTHC